MYIYIYIYMCVCVCVYVYIYIYLFQVRVKCRVFPVAQQAFSSFAKGVFCTYQQNETFVFDAGNREPTKTFAIESTRPADRICQRAPTGVDPVGRILGNRLKHYCRNGPCMALHKDSIIFAASTQHRCCQV